MYSYKYEVVIVKLIGGSFVALDKSFILNTYNLHTKSETERILVYI